MDDIQVVEAGTRSLQSRSFFINSFILFGNICRFKKCVVKCGLGFTLGGKSEGEADQIQESVWSNNQDQTDGACLSC